MAAADQVKGNLVVDGQKLDLNNVKVYDIFGSLMVVISDKPVGDIGPFEISEVKSGIRSLTVNIEKETGNLESNGAIVHEALSEQAQFMPDEAEIDVKKTGELTYSGLVRVADAEMNGHTISFDATFDIELPDPCAPATATYTAKKTPAAKAFADAYSEFAQCDFKGVADYLTTELAEQWLAELNGEEGEKNVSMLMDMMGMMPREIEIAVKELNGDDAVLTVSMMGEADEITMKREGGSWKVAGGWMF